jgi:hypothetical protein
MDTVRCRSNRNGGTTLGKGACRGKADAGFTAGAGDEGDPVFKAGFVWQTGLLWF